MFRRVGNNSQQCGLLQPEPGAHDVQVPGKISDIEKSLSCLLAGTLQLLLLQDNLPRAELCGQGCHPGQTQRAETEGGQG